MPHISIIGCDTRRQIKQVVVHAYVQFSSETFKSAKMHNKLQELADKLEAVVAEYFDGNTETELYNNHEWNTRFNRQ